MQYMNFVRYRKFHLTTFSRTAVVLRSGRCTEYDYSLGS